MIKIEEVPPNLNICIVLCCYWETNWSFFLSFFSFFFCIALGIFWISRQKNIVKTCQYWAGGWLQRPYLINFDATGSPCHELTSWDNSSSMSILLGRKESHCEDILPVSSTDGAAISPTISLALSLWYTRKCEIKENISGVLLLHVKLRNTK